MPSSPDAESPRGNCKFCEFVTHSRSKPAWAILRMIQSYSSPTGGARGVRRAHTAPLPARLENCPSQSDTTPLTGARSMQRTPLGAIQAQAASPHGASCLLATCIAVKIRTGMGGAYPHPRD